MCTLPAPRQSEGLAPKLSNWAVRWTSIFCVFPGPHINGGGIFKMAYMLPVQGPLASGFSASAKQKLLQICRFLGTQRSVIAHASSLGTAHCCLLLYEAARALLASRQAHTIFAVQWCLPTRMVTLHTHDFKPQRLHNNQLPFHFHPGIAHIMHYCHVLLRNL